MIVPSQLWTTAHSRADALEPEHEPLLGSKLTEGGKRNQIKNNKQNKTLNQENQVSWKKT